jgi:hypothetical protein
MLQGKKMSKSLPSVSKKIPSKSAKNAKRTSAPHDRRPQGTRTLRPGSLGLVEMKVYLKKPDTLIKRASYLSLVKSIYMENYSGSGILFERIALDCL